MTTPDHLSSLDLPEEALLEVKIAVKEWQNWREKGVTPCSNRTEMLIHALFQQERIEGANSVEADGAGMEDAAISDAA